MRCSWLHLLMSTRCILEMETSAQGFGSLSKNSRKNQWKINVFVLVYYNYCRAGNIYSQHKLLLALFTHEYKMYCRFLFTLTIRSPISYYPWTQNTTAVYSWEKCKPCIINVCLIMRNKRCWDVEGDSEEEHPPPPASRGQGDVLSYSINTLGNILRN